MRTFPKNMLAVGLLCLALPLSVSAATDAGWTALGQSSASARAAFQVALQKNPADPDALCGLGLMQQQADEETGAVVTLARLYAAAPASWQAAALWPQFTTLAEETGRWDLLESAALNVLAAKSALPIRPCFRPACAGPGSVAPGAYGGRGLAVEHAPRRAPLAGDRAV